MKDEEVKITLYMGSFNPFTKYHLLEAAVTYNIFETPVVIMPVLSAEGKKFLPCEDKNGILEDKLAPLEERVAIINASLEHPAVKGQAIIVHPEMPLTGKKDLVTIFGNKKLLSKLMGKAHLPGFKINQLLGYDVFALRSEDPHFLLSMNYSDLIVTATYKVYQTLEGDFDSFDVIFDMSEVMKQGNRDLIKHPHYFEPVPWAKEEYIDELPKSVIEKKDYVLIDKSEWPLSEDNKPFIRKVWQSSSTGKYIYFTNYARYGLRSKDLRLIVHSFVLQQKGLINKDSCNPFELINHFMVTDKATKIYLDAMGVKY
jgi:hypothetical protein